MIIEIEKDAEISIDKIALQPLYRVSIGAVHFIVSPRHIKIFWGLTSTNIEVKSAAIGQFMDFAERGVFDDPLGIANRGKEGIMVNRLSRVFRYFGLGTLILSLNLA